MLGADSAVDLLGGPARGAVSAASVTGALPGPPAPQADPRVQKCQDNYQLPAEVCRQGAEVLAASSLMHTGCNSISLDSPVRWSLISEAHVLASTGCSLG